MKYPLISFLLLAINMSVCIAQGNVLDSVIDPTKFGIHLVDDPDNQKTYVNADAITNTAAISLLDDENVYYFLVDKNFSIKTSFANYLPEPKQSYYGNKFEMIQQAAYNGKFCNFFKSINGSRIMKEEIDFNTKTVNDSLLFDFGSREKFLTTYTQGGQVYFLTIIKHSNKLRVYTNSNRNVKEIVLNNPANLPDFDLEYALRKVQVIKTEKESNLYEARESTKLYVGGNHKILLTLDDNFRFTVLYSISLDSFNASSQTIYKNLRYCNSLENADDIQTNSFAYNQYLLQAAYCPNDLVITVKEIATDSVVNEFHASRDSTISFAGSDLIKRQDNTKTAMGLSDNITEGHKTKTTVKKWQLRSNEFFRLINDHHLSLIIVPVKGGLVLKIGEAHGMSSDFSNGGGGFYGPSVVIGGIPSAPSYFASSPGNAYDVPGRVETYFETQLTAVGFNYIPTTASETLYDKIDNVKTPVKRVMGTSIVFDFNGHTYFLFWHKKEKTGIVKLVQ